MANAPSTAPSAADSREAQSSESGTIKYTGYAGVREITKAQWKKAGVEEQDTTIWDEGNGYTLPLSAFSQAAVEVVKREPHFKITQS